MMHNERPTETTFERLKNAGFLQLAVEDEDGKLYVPQSSIRIVIDGFEIGEVADLDEGTVVWTDASGEKLGDTEYDTPMYVEVYELKRIL